MNQKGNWEAWVDTMPGPGTKRPELRVHGDIKVYGKAKHSLEKAVPQGINPKILILEVVPKPSAGDVDTHLEYRETLEDSKQYTHVIIREIEDVTVEVKEVS